MGDKSLLTGSQVYIAYDLSKEEITHSRSVYNLLDFLGDNGGLFEGLCYVAQGFFIIFSFFETNPTLIYLVTRIFKVKKE